MKIFAYHHRPSNVRFAVFDVVEWGNISCPGDIYLINSLILYLKMNGNVYEIGL